MDIFAHALWTAASAVTARRRLELRIRWVRAVAWGVFPDLAAFTAPAAVRIWRLSTGRSRSLLPDGAGPSLNWAWDLYNFTHSALVFAVVFGGLWFILRRPVLEMLGWALHIVIDIFTHAGLFATLFFWPLSGVHVDGIRWEAGWFLATNYIALAAVYVLLWISSGRRALTEPALSPGRTAAAARPK